MAVLTQRYAAGSQRSPQHIGTGSHPFDARIFNNAQRAITDRALRRPAAARQTAEHTLKHAQGFLHVPGGALWAARIGRMLRPRRGRLGLARGTEVQQQRQYGMAVGRNGQLTTTFVCQRAVARQHTGQQFADDDQQLAAMLRAELAAVLA